MTKNKYSMYGVMLLAGAVAAVWAGLPPSYLFILLACPLMMFFMMRGMRGEQKGHDDNGSESRTHERIDHP